MKSTSFWRSGVIVRLAAAMSPLPATSARQQLVAPHRNEDHPHLQVLVLEFLFGGELLVELVLEQPGVLNGGAALYALVDEIDGLAVDGQHADDPPLDHPVQITGPRLLHLREIDGEGLASRLLWRLLLGERAGVDAGGPRWPG